jgi:N-methylhydantoinase B
LLLIREGEETSVELPSMLPTIAISKGDKIRAIGGIGGGYGNPFNRPAEQVLEDVLDGYLTVEMAAEDFGVAISSDRALDREETARLRQARA